MPQRSVKNYTENYTRTTATRNFILATASVGKILRQPITKRLLNSSFVLHQGSKLTSQASRRMNDYYLSFINESCACPYVTKGQYMSSVLTDHRDIKQAQGLLYDNYNERQWCWSIENPTGKSIFQFYFRNEFY